MNSTDSVASTADLPAPTAWAETQASAASADRFSLADDFRRVRARSLAICAPLAADDYGIQPMDDASPPKWHLAHTTWFFETFLLKPHEAQFVPFHPRFEYLFNSYYNAVGSQYPRTRRGQMSRPTLDEVRAYRADVDARMLRLLELGSTPWDAQVMLGLQHEEQHQELLLTDIKYNLGNNPLRPAYRNDLAPVHGGTAAVLQPQWLELAAAHWPIGQPAGDGSARSTFRFDNETPRHSVALPAFAIASAPVNNAQYLAFVQADGYARPDLWLADGWARIKRDGWLAPLYWLREPAADGTWYEYTLGGVRPLDLAAPVSHISFYEADAYARWAGARLPSEFEWEALATGQAVRGNLQDSNCLHPSVTSDATSHQVFGDVWEWTATPYQAYPGFRASGGALGEYNGKFMCNQMVLRGGSALTVREHLRASYRNFFYPPDRWQMSGLRLARDDG